MSNRTLTLTDTLYTYLLDVSLRETPLLRQLRDETARHPESQMQIAPEQGQFMALLVRLMGARKALEVGVFTGYSSLVVATALPDDGRLVACDVSDAYTQVARRYWEEAGVTHKIDLRIGAAEETLDALIADAAEAGTFDFAFVDADKTGYNAYYERALALLRPGGLLVLDNMLRGGRVANPDDTDAGTRTIQALNRKLRDDARIELSLLPLADGITLALKR